MTIYFAKVESIDDPLKANRVRVRVYHIHSQDKAKIPTDKLFWSTVILPNTSASMGGIGQTHGLLVGSTVVGTFIDAIQQQFIVIGSFYGVNNESPSPSLQNYPNNRVSVSETGHSLQFNDATGEVIISNSTGNNILLNASANIKSVSDVNIDSDANTNINVGGNFNAVSGGNGVISSTGSLNINSGSVLSLTAPRIELNGDFSFVNPSLTDLSPITIKTRKAITPLTNSSTGISTKDEVTIVEEVLEGNVCTMEAPKDLYEVSLETTSVEWDNIALDNLFQEMGFNEGIYEDDMYWGAIWLGAMLKRAGYKYLKSPSAKDYLDYQNSSDIKKDITTTDMVKGDVIIFTRNDGFFVGVYSGEKDETFNSYKCVVGDFTDSVVETQIDLTEEVTIKRIIRPRLCNDNKVVYSGKCEIPKIKTGFMIHDDLIVLALNIYHEARGETKIFSGETYPRGQVAAAWSVLNRLDLLTKFGDVRGYKSFRQPFRKGLKRNPLTVSGLVMSRYQYSWVLPVKINSKGQNVGGIRNWQPTDLKKWCLALEISQKVLNREIADPTDINKIGLGSTHYFNEQTFGPPAWYPILLRRGWKPYQIQRHTFMIPPNTSPMA